MNTTNQNTNTSANSNPQVSVVLSQIEQFGFKYFGNDENNAPLVTAPNGQVIPLKVAYDFVQLQIKKASDTSSGGNLEQMPVMPPSVDSSSLEVNIEKSAEKESSIEKASEKQSNINTAQNAQASTPQVATPVVDIKMPMPFDEGFKVTKFDPTDLNQVEDYIQSNKNGSTSNTSTWLANQFEKFLQEYKSKK